MKMVDHIDRYIDSNEIDILYKLIEVADKSIDSRIELLFRLEFKFGSKKLYKLNSIFLKLIDEYSNILLIVAVIVALIAVVFRQNILGLGYVLSIIAVLFTYLSWRRKQRSETVDDALQKKIMANTMIVDNKSILVPYTGNVFDFNARYAEKNFSIDERVIIDMYVFTEIDNLEFVFDKSRAHLIDDSFTIRAIKIFIARAENDGFFNVARRLIKSGRYNEDFSQTAIKLLYVGHCDM